MNTGIRTRLNCLVLAGLLPLLFLTGALIWHDLSDDYGKARLIADNAAQYAAANVDVRINELSVLLLVLGRAVSFNPADAEKNDTVLRASRADLPAYANNILVFDLKGNNIGMSQWPLGDRSQLFSGQLDYFKAALEGRVAVGHPMKSRLNSNGLLTWRALCLTTLASCGPSLSLACAWQQSTRSLHWETFRGEPRSGF